MKSFRQFIETVTTGAAPGAGDDSSTVIISPNRQEIYRKKNQKNQNKITKYVRAVMVP